MMPTPILDGENHILPVRGQKTMIDADLARHKFARTLPFAFTGHGAIWSADALIGKWNSRGSVKEYLSSSEAAP
jgi:hypothetical protein